MRKHLHKKPEKNSTIKNSFTMYQLTIVSRHCPNIHNVLNPSLRNKHFPPSLYLSLSLLTLQFNLFVGQPFWVGQLHVQNDYKVSKGNALFVQYPHYWVWGSAKMSCHLRGDTVKLSETENNDKLSLNGISC